MVLLQQLQVKEFIRFKLLTCYAVEDHPEILVLDTNGAIIPKTQFQEALIAIGQLIVRGKYNKIILNKQLVALLDSSCLEWYTSVWMELMKHHGLQHHCFIMPERNKTNVDTEAFSEIHLCGSLDEAVDL